MTNVFRKRSDLLIFDHEFDNRLRNFCLFKIITMYCKQKLILKIDETQYSTLKNNNIKVDVLIVCFCFF